MLRFLKSLLRFLKSLLRFLKMLIGNKGSVWYLKTTQLTLYSDQNSIRSNVAVSVIYTTVLKPRPRNIKSKT